MPKQDKKGVGWTILAAALTNTPRARQKENPVGITEIDGTEYLRVPLIKKCRIRYGHDVIVFGQEQFDEMLKNHQNQVWDAPPYIRVGHYDNPGLAWFAPLGGEEPSGKMVQEGDWLVAYALPTDDEVRKATRGYKFASIDLHPDYRSNQMELAFSSADFEEVDEEADMPTSKDEKDTTLTFTKKDHEAIVEKYSNELEDARKELEKVQRQLEKERAESQRQLYLSRVESLISEARARTSEDGQAALPAFTINTVESILKLEAIESGSGVIKLDREQGHVGFTDYVYRALSHLLLNMPLESVPVEGNTTHQEESPDAEKIQFGMTEKELEKFYDENVSAFWGNGGGVS